MPSTAIQATTRVTFRVSGTKPSPVLVFAKGGRKWIVASEVCRILGLRTDTVPQLVPEQERSRAAVLTKGSVQSVITITEEGFNLLVAQSAKPTAKALREWMVGDVLPSIPFPRKSRKGRGSFSDGRQPAYATGAPPAPVAVGRVARWLADLPAKRSARHRVDS